MSKTPPINLVHIPGVTFPAKTPPDKNALPNGKPEPNDSDVEENEDNEELETATTTTTTEKKPEEQLFNMED